MRIRGDVLFDTLRLMKPIYRKNHYVPMTRVKLTVEPTYEAELSATNGDVWLTTQVGFNSEEETFSILFDPRHLEGFLSPEDQYVDIRPFEDETTDKVVVSTDQWSTTIQTYPVDDFPLAPKINPHIRFHLTDREWKQLAKVVVSSAAQDDSRPVLACVYVERKSDDVIATAADGFRLTTSVITRNTTEFSPFLFPVSCIKVLPKTIRTMGVYMDDENRSLLSLDLSTQRTKNSQVLYSSVVIRLNEGQFPDYPQILPKTEDLVGSCSVPLWIVKAAAKIKTGRVFRLSQHHAELAYGEKEKMNWDSSSIVFRSNPGYEFLSGAFNPTYLLNLAEAIDRPDVIHLSASKGHQFLASNGKTSTLVMGMVLGTDGEYYRTLDQTPEAA